MEMSTLVNNQIALKAPIYKGFIYAAIYRAFDQNKNDATKNCK